MVVCLFQTWCHETPLNALSACVSEFLCCTATVHLIRCLWERIHDRSISVCGQSLSASAGCMATHNSMYAADWNDSCRFTPDNYVSLLVRVSQWLLHHCLPCKQIFVVFVMFDILVLWLDSFTFNNIFSRTDYLWENRMLPAQVTLSFMQTK